ncbi:3-methylitaconate isomerase [Tepidanaerobacter acetatoxydans Re1]|uniref:3-methylitaconate isomerase n=1 Tax=Tepidanaerobacter acetatoxydans (strain DSM 21804 / JCM 16047 / Re1) TaxID=1209989 RepID=F4LUN6_TEPAE|nr:MULTISPECIES: PrpF domain-containing protein [Tepidanaerobacter]AEE90604.1 PrpF protein [Tepidanaerobacter acetatoxydans Re1]CCP25125.1 3-methylitaconate isomerase [Tepidanaerobacter acetatoxydans Re1]
MEQEKIRAVIMRAGTSKGIFLRDEDLPKDKDKRDETILKIFGSPDVRQIDGLGGADPLTSKVAIIGPPSRSDADIDYTFGQVSYVAPTIDYSGNCGNISSGVGPFAIDEGLVKVEEPYTIVRVHNTNTNSILIEQVQVVNGKAKVLGDYKIDGVPGTGAEISIDFSQTAGAKTGKLLPTGNVKDKIQITNLGELEVSIVDAANPMVFVRAVDLGLTGTETPEEIDGNQKILDILEEIRSKTAQTIGMVKDWREAKTKSPAFPMVAFVSPASDYKDFTTGQQIREEDIDFVSRLMFMQIMHKTYAGTGTICTGAAARIDGTVVNEVMKEKHRGKDPILRIGHPAGIITIDVCANHEEGKWNLKKAAISRTARRIMEGYCYIPKER